MTFAVTVTAATAAYGAYSSNRAAKSQADAANRGLEMTQEQYNQSRADLAPWRSGGASANQRLQDLLGIGSGESLGLGELKAPTRDAFTKQRLVREAMTVGPTNWASRTGGGGATVTPAQYAQDFDQSGYDQAVANYQAGMHGRAGALGNSPFGSLLKPFTPGDLTSEPGYQFGLGEGERGIERANRATGTLRSGATLKALQRFGQDYAGTKYDQAFNRDMANRNTIYGMLSGQSGVGANAAGQTAGLGANAAAQGAQLLGNAGDARAAGQVGVANALSGGVSQYLGNRQSQGILDYLKGIRQPTSNDSFSRSGGF